MITRVRELPPATVTRYTEWWREVGVDTGKRALALYPLTGYEAYFTPEQLADYAEFGVIVFQGSEGTVCVLQLGTHAVPFGEGGIKCMRTHLGLMASMVAYKLLWQTDEAAARSIAGREGAKLVV